MATRGTPLDAATVRAIQRSTLSVRKTARRERVDKNTVLKYRKKRVEVSDAGSVPLPLAGVERFR